MSFEALRPLDAIDVEPEAPRTDSIGRGRLSLAFALVMLTILGAAVVLGMAASAAYLTIPFSDVHDWIGRVFATEQTHDWMGYLWQPHGNQRIPTARALTAFDVELGRGRWPSFLLGAAFAWLLAFLALAVCLVRARYAATTRLALALLVGMLGMNIALAEDFAFPVFSVYLLVAGPAIAALAILPLAAARGWRSPLFWLALGLAWLASFGNAAGLAVWPALIVALVLQRAGRATIGVAVAMMLACVIGLEAGLGAPSASLGNGGEGGAHFIKILSYFLIFGGLPWSRAPHPLLLQAAVGLVVWVAALMLFRRGLRTQVREPIVVSGMALILFGLVTAAMASIGRVDELPQPIVPTRYTPFATALQIGILLAGAGLANDLRFRRPIVSAAFTAAAALLILAGTAHGMRALERAADRIRAASVTFDRTGTQGDVQLHPRPAVAAAVRAELARRGLPH